VSRNGFWNRWDLGVPPEGGVEDSESDRKFEGTRWAWWFDEQWRWVCLSSFVNFSAYQDYCLVKTLPVEACYDGAKNKRQEDNRKLAKLAQAFAEWRIENPPSETIWWPKEVEYLRDTLVMLARKCPIVPTKRDKCRWFCHRYFEESELELTTQRVGDAVDLAVALSGVDGREVSAALEGISLPKYLKSFKTEGFERDLDIYTSYIQKLLKDEEFNKTRELRANSLTDQIIARSLGRTLSGVPDRGGSGSGGSRDCLGAQTIPEMVPSAEGERR
jgi:hypothetical protein